MLMDPEKVAKGRLKEPKHMNDHHVYDWIDEADIPKGTKSETPRWCGDLKPRDGVLSCSSTTLSNEMKFIKARRH